MLKLIVGNSESLLQGFTDKQFKEIREVLSYNIPAQANYFSGGYGSPKRYLIDKRGTFPTGLLTYLTQFLADSKIIYNIVDSRVRPRGVLLKGFTLKLGHSPHQWQTDAVKAAVAHSRGTISASTGTGKSIAMAMLVQAFQLKTLIIVPNLTLKTQLIESFLVWFGPTPNITIDNIDSPKLKNPNKSDYYDVLIIDEAHHTAAATYRKLNKKQWAGIYYRFFFTATPFRSRDEEQLLFESVAGQVIYRIGYREAVENNYIVPVEAYYIEIPPTQLKGNSTKWASVYSELVVHNTKRNSIIHKILLKLHVNKVSTLCLVKEIAHGNNLLTLVSRVTNDDPIMFVSGVDTYSNKNIAMFNKGIFKVLIGTVGVLGEGVDTKPAEYVIIAGLGKSKPQFMQSVGRGIRRYKDKESCKVIIIKDNSHAWTKKHFKEQCAILKEEYGVVPIKIEI